MADATESHQDAEGKPKQLSGADLDAMLAEARTRFEYACDVDGDNRNDARDDFEFVWVKNRQWSQAALDARDKWDQPCLEASQLTQFIKQVVNDQRQNRPGIKVSAASGDASEETAKTLQGMVRHIEYDSKAEATYDNAFEHAVTGGRGYWRIASEYENPRSFNQKLVIKPVPDWEAVYCDPDYKEPDGSDMGWAFVVDKMTEKAFKAAYPNAKPVDFDAKDSGKWFESGKGATKFILVADYYRRVCTKKALLLLADGSSMWRDEYEAAALEMPAGTVAPPIVSEREADHYAVEWFKIAGGQQMLEQYAWPGTYIPVVQDAGDEITIGGRRLFQGLIRRVKDLQRAYNYLISAGMERVALAPKAPYVMAEGQDEGYENEWADANHVPYSSIKYKPVMMADGVTPAPPPMRQSPVQAEMGLFQQAEAIKQDIKSVLGMYENSLGMRSQETSGRAIIAREKQGDNATFNFVDNLSRAIAHTGRILLELIPHYYDTQRVVAIIGDDDTKSTVTINEAVPAVGGVEAALKNDVKTGQYAVAVQAGPSYATQRQETAELMAQLVQSFPPIMQVAGDLVVKAQQLPDADALAERMELMLPPPVQQMIAAKKQGQTPPDPAVMAQMQQLQGQLQQAGQAVQQLTAENQQLKAGAAEKIQTAEINAAASVREAEIQAAADARTAIMRAQTEQETKITIAAMQQPAVPEPGAMGDEAEVPGMAGGDAIVLLAEQVAELAKVAAAPRAMQIQTDANGRVTGGTSQVAVVQ